MGAGASRPDRVNVAVAVSGGRDSVALLHCVARMSRTLPIHVHALHVNHRLQAQADDWHRQLASQCRRWARRGMQLTFHAQRLEGEPQRGDSVEAWARRHRYNALAAMARAHRCGIVLLAHHGNDQAETVLLQALRGAGPAGLSAMPRCLVRAGLCWARPWLERPREEIEAYLRRHRLSYVDDPSNESTRFWRNRLRHAVWPALIDQFPAAAASLQAVARRAQEAAELSAEVAAIDATQVVEKGRLQLEPWRQLGPARRRNLMRSWLAGISQGPVPESLLDRLAAELPGKHAGRWPAGAGELRLHRGLLRWLPAPLTQPLAVPDEVALDLSRPGRHAVPGWGGHLIVEAVDNGGVDARWLHVAAVRPRAGGESFQSAPQSTPRSLKKQYQAFDVPAWSREGPLVWAAERLVFVAGLGIDARCIAQPGVPQRQIRWRPDEGEASGTAG